MSRRKQSNPKPLKHQEESDDVSPPEIFHTEEAAMKTSSLRINCDLTATESECQLSGQLENSSAGKLASPAGKSVSPAGELSSSSDKSELPVDKSELPVDKSELPVDKSVSPAGKSSLPAGKSVSPTVKSVSPTISPASAAASRRSPNSPSSDRVSPLLPVVKSEPLPIAAVPSSCGSALETATAPPALLIVSPTQTVARGMVCSCGISFSSLSTFSAHQKFYCTNRNSPALTKDRVMNSVEDSVESRCSPESEDRPSSYPHSSHSPEKSTFSCNQCAFVTDKVSGLSKHKRIHSPAQSTSVDKDRVEDRFCRSCDIQFSSLKTFFVHKQHYCQTRLGKNSVNISTDQTVSEPEHNERLFILPTDPPILVSLQAIQNATLAPSSFIERSNTRMSPYVILADGLVPLNLLIERDDVLLNNSKSDMNGSNIKVSVPPNPVKLPFLPADPKNQYHLPWMDKEDPTDLAQDKPLDLTHKRKRNCVSSNAFTKQKKCRSSSYGSETPPSSSIDAADTVSKSNSLPEENCQRTESSSSDIAPRICVRPLRSIMELPIDASKRPVDRTPQTGNPVIDLPGSMWKALASGDRPMPIPTMAALMSNGPLRSALSSWSPALGQPSAGERNGPICCEDCGVSFQKQESYRVHRASYCSGRDNNPERISPKEEKISISNNAQERLSSPSLASPQQMKYSCRMCKTKFMSQDTLNAHQSFYCSAVYNGLDETSLGSETSARVKEVVKSEEIGWKCPCCALISVTAMAAQKHLETHNNVRAFKCSMCGYKGNTLRGMRTHIRMHFSEKKSVDMSEESFISCIVANSDDEDLLSTRESKNEKCPLCPFKSSNPESMVKHFTLAHPTTPRKAILSDSDISEGSSSSLAASSLRVSEKCPLCSFYTDVPEIMTQHQTVRHGIVMDVEGKEVSPNSSILLHGNNSDPCPSNHVDGQPAQQQEDSRVPSQGSSSAAQSHSDSPDAAISSEKRPERSIRCNHCDISFKQRASFEAHVQFYCPGRIASANRSLTPVQ